MNQIKQGYKQTKVGIIPEDWEVVKLGKVTKINPNNKNLPENFIYIDLESVVKGKLLKQNFISKYEAPSRAQRVLKKNDILFQMVRPYQMNNLFFEFDGDYVASTGYAQIRTNQSDKYIFQYIHLKRFVDKVLEKCTGSNYPAINSSDLSDILIILPPLKEQEKIAEILTTWDEAITKQTELLRAKELLKIALMQKLLSGEVRFDGFSDKWEEVKIKDIFEITRGYVLAVTEMSQEQTAEYKYPVYSSQTKNNGLTGYYKDYLFENCITWTTDGANAGDVNLRKGKFYCTNVCGVLKSDKGYANQCIAEILNLVTKNYVSYVGNPKLMNNTMGGIKIKIPKSLPEQQKIAEVLSLADDEINLLKNELEELKLQKKALMQKLLTGEVRVKV